MRVFLIDGSSYIFRAYHALPPLTRASDGMPVGAVHGFCQMLWKLLQDTKEAGEPTHFAVIFDAARKTFRSDIYPEYKAHRPPAPEDLVPQFDFIRQAVDAFGLPRIEQDGYEADDIIASYVKQTVAEGGEAVIVSSDKDLMQLIQPGVTMFDGMKNKVIGPDEVVAKFGVGPEKVIDVQSLAGDSSDNVPGVPGIGVKTAALLIDEFGDLDQLLAGAETIKQKKRRENLIEFAEQARISRELVTLCQDVPDLDGLDRLTLAETEEERLLSFLGEMGFAKLTERVAASFGVEAPKPKQPSKAAKALAKGAKTGSPFQDGGSDTEPGGGAEAVAAASLEEMRSVPLDPSLYETITSLRELEAWLAAAKDQGFVAIDTETTGLDAMSVELVGISLALTPGKAAYIPLTHRSSDGLDLLGDGEIEQVPMDEALALLKPLLEDPAVLKIGQNIKYDWVVMARQDIAMAPIDDTMLMSYALDAGVHGHGMDELSKHYFDHEPIAFKEIVGTGKAQITFDLVPVAEATKYAAEDADVTLRLWHVLKARLAAAKRMTVYETLERPLVSVLAKMEMEGVVVDRSILAGLSKGFAEKLAELEEQIHQLTDETFNIASPKQLGEVLFEKLNYKGGKKTKTGAWATGAGVLEGLAVDEGLSEEERLLPQTILDWRQLSKLKSTYSDALPKFINEETGRVHTSYSLAATSTGRLASTDPNIQNIPIRTAEGREIRKAFVAASGNVLLSADYSQIELRILAHMADIPQLIEAFHEGQDIHALTASEMFGVPLKDMDPMTRRRAKAINFGIIYGISAFGLANQLGISRSEASDYIKTYFKRFPGIQTYMNNIKEQVADLGYVETLFGRRVHYPGVKTNNRQQKAFFERAAINAPIQGTAADIIRRAMVRIGPLFADFESPVKMLLQVHDELIFEVEQEKADAVTPLICEVMEQANTPIIELKVPLKVDARHAENWDEAH
ncbi:MAG: DNA polymerase I [Rhizobiales bacterium]|nr:DNA polymerase I [Hyphomicrobiales bacterium]